MATRGLRRTMTWLTATPACNSWMCWSGPRSFEHFVTYYETLLTCFRGWALFVVAAVPGKSVLHTQANADLHERLR